MQPSASIVLLYFKEIKHDREQIHKHTQNLSDTIWHNFKEK